MTSEKPCAEVNKQLNPRVPHGKNYHLSGTTSDGPTAEAALRILRATTEICENMPSLHHVVIFDVMHMGAVNSIPNDAMAFNCRGPHINVVVNMSWEQDAIDIERVRASSKSLIEAVHGGTVSPGNPYGNYGKS